jgi:hypothetical protein
LFAAAADGTYHLFEKDGKAIIYRRQAFNEDDSYVDYDVAIIN